MFRIRAVNEIAALGEIAALLAQQLLAEHEHAINKILSISKTRAW